MEKYILKDDDGSFLHFETWGIVSWFNINPACLCAFDSKKEAQEVIDIYGLSQCQIITECFSDTYFDD